MPSGADAEPCRHVKTGRFRAGTPHGAVATGGIDMIAARVACLLMAVWLLAPSDALAKQRGNSRSKNNGNGPAFCRSGAGHPVHGWAWCRERGWSREDRKSVV